MRLIYLTNHSVYQSSATTSILNKLGNYFYVGELIVHPVCVAQYTVCKKLQFSIIFRLHNSDNHASLSEITGFAPAHFLQEFGVLFGSSIILFNDLQSFIQLFNHSNLTFSFKIFFTLCTCYSNSSPFLSVGKDHAISHIFLLHKMHTYSFKV